MEDIEDKEDEIFYNCLEMWHEDSFNSEGDYAVLCDRCKEKIAELKKSEGK